MSEDLNKLFDSARNEKPTISFEKVSERFTQSVQANQPRVQLKNSQWLTLKNGIIMTTLLISIGIGLSFLSFNQPEKRKLDNTSKKSEVTASVKEAIVESSTPELSLPLEPVKNIAFRYKKYELVPLPLYFETNYFIHDDTLNDSKQNEKNNANWKDEYPFPKLTQEEIDANHKQKKKMLKAMEKLDKKSLAYVPSGTFDYLGKKVSLQAFYMSKTEVTNLEYRTFLFDLLIQGRKDDFLKAKPDQSQWAKIEGLTAFALNPMEEHYFSHPEYNDYPVVNISREGAEMYCVWLSKELYQYVGKDKMEKYNDFRIPGRVEWVYAASSGGVDYPFPWKGEFVRNSDGCFLANYKPFQNSYFDDGGFFTVKVDSYNPNSIGIYNMSGNVSEMVYNSFNSRENPGTCGGGWLSNMEEIKILGPDPYEGKTEAHANIGFRFVMTYTGR
jgi:sulfatase modifying factor 1